MEAAFVYPLLTVAAFYLGARAMITQWLWSRYPPWLDGFMSCPACSGFWYGGAFSIAGHFLGWRFLGASSWWVVFTVALCSIVWTPIIAAVMEWGIRRLHIEVAIEEVESEE